MDEQANKEDNNFNNLIFDLEKNLENFSKTGDTPQLFSNFKKILVKYS